MPIYPDLKLVFVHVQKTAGGSIVNLLAPYKAPGQKTPLNRLMAKIPLRRNIMSAYIPPHATATYLRTVMGQSLWDNYTSFAVVRNPYDRAISAYEYRRQTPHHHGHAQSMQISFADFSTKVRGMSQIDLICDKTGNLIVDQIIKFENLHEPLNALLREKGVKERLTRTGNQNSSTKRPRKRYLTPEAVAVINAKHKAEFDLFGYDMIA